MARKPKKPPNDWTTLGRLINRFAECRVADAEKGGGDPADIRGIEAELTIAHLRLEAHIAKIRRQYRALQLAAGTYHPGDES